MAGRPWRSEGAGPASPERPAAGEPRHHPDPVHRVLLAETIHASGVVAVVVSGLMMSQIGPRVVRADTGRQGEAFCSLSTFRLNGTLFILVGLELQTAVRDLTSVDLTT
jgi:NhaP-type Na+/H+ or K+/H+ antiporter